MTYPHRTQRGRRALPGIIIVTLAFVLLLNPTIRSTIWHGVVIVLGFVARVLLMAIVLLSGGPRRR